ncbi:MAG: selenide, water dikinase SelD, partial [Desulfovibrio sp.]
LGLKAATDVTGFGLGGHVLEMARASNVSVTLNLDAVPFIEQAVDMASMGMIPAGSFANKQFCSSSVHVVPGLDSILVDLVFDAQTSGGLVLAMDAAQVAEASAMLTQGGHLAQVIGRVEPRQTDVDQARLTLSP